MPRLIYGAFVLSANSLESSLFQSNLCKYDDNPQVNIYTSVDPLDSSACIIQLLSFVDSKPANWYLTNSDDPDEMPQLAALRQGHHCLLKQREISPGFLRYYCLIDVLLQ